MNFTTDSDIISINQTSGVIDVRPIDRDERENEFYSFEVITILRNNKKKPKVSFSLDLCFQMFDSLVLHQRIGSSHRGRCQRQSSGDFLPS